MPHSNFKNDLNKEARLSRCLDILYPKYFESSSYTIERIRDLSQQHQGIDLVLKNANNVFYVDEKAQLDYVNSHLPTFAFELSYLKDNKWHKGWLFDELKSTDIYFLVTNIHFDENATNDSLLNVRVTGVYREKLIDLLSRKGLTEAILFSIEKELRQEGKHGRFPIQELNSKSEGALFFSKNNKSEQPINLVLKLDYLIKKDVGKIIIDL